MQPSCSGLRPNKRLKLSGGDRFKGSGELCARQLLHELRYSTRMGQTLALVTVIVRDYDAAIAYYTQVLGFRLLEDSPLNDGKRWVRVAPAGSKGAGLLLARAATPAQWARAGDQTGGRVFLFLETDDCWRDYREMKGRGVRFKEEPRVEPYGTVAVFEDLYGNRWDLVQPVGR